MNKMDTKASKAALEQALSDVLADPSDENLAKGIMLCRQINDEIDNATWERQERMRELLKSCVKRGSNRS